MNPSLQDSQNQNHKRGVRFQNYCRFSANSGRDASRDVIATHVPPKPSQIHVRRKQVQLVSFKRQQTSLRKTVHNYLVRFRKSWTDWSRKDWQILWIIDWLLTTVDGTRSYYFKSAVVIKDVIFNGIEKRIDSTHSPLYVSHYTSWKSTIELHILQRIYFAWALD